MKKKISIIMSLILSFLLLVGCGGNTKSPTEFVNDYFKEVKDGTQSEIAQEILGEQLSDEDMPKEAVDAIIGMLGKLEVTPSEEKIDGEKAIVNVDVKGVSFKTIISMYVANIMEQAMNMDSVSMSEEDEDKLIMDTLIKTINEAPLENRTGVINLTKSGDEWTVVDDDDLDKVIFGISEEEMKSLGE